MVAKCFKVFAASRAALDLLYFAVSNIIDDIIEYGACVAFFTTSKHR